MQYCLLPDFFFSDLLYSINSVWCSYLDFTNANGRALKKPKPSKTKQNKSATIIVPISSMVKTCLVTLLWPFYLLFTPVFSGPMHSCGSQVWYGSKHADYFSCGWRMFLRTLVTKARLPSLILQLPTWTLNITASGWPPQSSHLHGSDHLYSILSSACLPVCATYGGYFGVNWWS